VGVSWRGAALVDGKAWPVYDNEAVWLPAGAHTVEAAPEYDGARVLRLNAELKSARVAEGGAIELSYASAGRAIAILDRVPKRVRVDGTELKIEGSGTAIQLPEGHRTVRLEFAGTAGLP
jgi:hypothetical protein